MATVGDRRNGMYVKYVVAPMVIFAMMNAVESDLENRVTGTSAAQYLSGSVLADDDSISSIYQKMGREMKILNQQKKYLQVIQDYERYADKEDNKSSLFYNELGLAYVNTKSDWKKSEAFLKKAHELNKKDTAPMLGLAVTYVRLKDCGQARKYAQMYLDSNGQRSDAATKIIQKCE